MVAIIINTAVSLVVACISKKYGKKHFLPVLVITALIPLFGVIIILSAYTKIQQKNHDLSEPVFDDICSPADTFDVFDDSNMDFMNIMPIQDALTLRNIKQKRKLLFSSFTGNRLRLYPLLLKALKERDTEIVHYASSIITDYRREINELFEKTKEKHAAYPADNNVFKEYIEVFHNLIYWGELNGTEEKCKREAFETLLDQKKFVEEKQYLQKIRNEIALKKYDNACMTCISFTGAYPESCDPYVALLEFYYCTKQYSAFKETLLRIKHEEILLSSDACGIVSFWKNKITSWRGL